MRRTVCFAAFWVTTTLIEHVSASCPDPALVVKRAFETGAHSTCNALTKLLRQVDQCIASNGEDGEMKRARVVIEAWRRLKSNCESRRPIILPNCEKPIIDLKDALKQPTEKMSCNKRQRHRGYLRYLLSCPEFSLQEHAALADEAETIIKKIDADITQLVDGEKCDPPTGTETCQLLNEMKHHIDDLNAKIKEATPCGDGEDFCNCQSLKMKRLEMLAPYLGLVKTSDCPDAKRSALASIEGIALDSTVVDIVSHLAPGELKGYADLKSLLGSPSDRQRLIEKLNGAIRKTKSASDDDVKISELEGLVSLLDGEASLSDVVAKVEKLGEKTRKRLFNVAGAIGSERERLRNLYWQQHSNFLHILAPKPEKACKQCSAFFGKLEEELTAYGPKRFSYLDNVAISAEKSVLERQLECERSKDKPSASTKQGCGAVLSVTVQNEGSDSVRILSKLQFIHPLLDGSKYLVKEISSPPFYRGTEHSRTQEEAARVFAERVAMAYSEVPDTPIVKMDGETVLIQSSDCGLRFSEENADQLIDVASSGLTIEGNCDNRAFASQLEKRLEEFEGDLGERLAGDASPRGSLKLTLHKLPSSNHIAGCEANLLQNGKVLFSLTVRVNENAQCTAEDDGNQWVDAGSLVALRLANFVKRQRHRQDTSPDRNRWNPAFAAAAITTVITAGAWAGFEILGYKRLRDYRHSETQSALEHDKLKTLRVASRTLLGLSLAGFVTTGIFFWFTDFVPERQSRNVRIAFSPMTNGAALAISGRF